MRTIYCYHFETYNTLRINAGMKPLFKIGDTTITAVSPEDAAMIRIGQQDTTACSEPLIMDFAIEIPDSFMPNVQHVDQKFHDWLRHNKNIYKYRKDAEREWFGSFNSSDEVKAYINEFLYNKHAANSWSMRKCQQAAHDKIVNYYKNNGTEFLLAAKMRFGKNFTFLNVIKTLGVKNVLVLTYKPTVFESLEEDIKSHINFINDIKYSSYKDEREQLILDNTKINIVSCSAQMAGYKYDEETNDDIIEYDNNVDIKKNLLNLSKINWDIIITDECHYGTDTQNFKNICNVLSCNKILYISGTPFKTIGNFSDDALYMYTYTDEQNDPENTGMAKLYQYGIKMDTKLIDTYKKLIEIVEYPTMQKIFQCTNFEFTYPDIAKGLIDDIIHRGIRQSGMKNIKHMFILFDSVAACIAASNYINNQYNTKFIGINAGGDKGIKTVDDLKEYIAEAEADGKGTITCSCGRFVEGTTVQPWNATIMCQDGESPERYFQAMFRGQSPAKGKDSFYVIDYNPERLLKLNYKMISELPTGNKSSRNNTRENNVKEWLRATPIVITENDTDQTQRIVDYIEIERTFFDKGNADNKFANNYVFNRIQNITLTKDDCNNIMSNIERVDNVLNKDCSVNTNNLDGGKNRVSKTSSKKNKKQSNNQKNNEYTISDVIASIKNAIKYIPKFICVFNCHTVEDIINILNTNKDDAVEYFEYEVNMNAQMFIDIVTTYNIINSDGFKYICDEFWEQYNLHVVNSTSAKDKHKFGINWNLYK